VAPEVRHHRVLATSLSGSSVPFGTVYDHRPQAQDRSEVTGDLERSAPVDTDGRNFSVA